MASAFHVYFGPIVVRKIGPRDCFAALREGLDDFIAMLTHVAFLGLFYALWGDRARSVVVVRQCLASRVPVRRRFCADRAFLRCRPLRVEPEARKRTAGVVA